MNAKQEQALIEYILEKMMSAEQIMDMLRKAEIGKIPRVNKEKLRSFVRKRHPEITLDAIRKHLRETWKGKNDNARIEGFIANLKSGKLDGHDWHGARPSTLHLSLQDKVRACSSGTIGIDELIEMGADIMKHEYFMTAQHDVLENAIIDRLEDVIPSILSRGITDFVYRGVPVDLKVTNYKDAYKDGAGRLSDDQKSSLMSELLAGADTNRVRKQAVGTNRNWGLNRMYVLVKDQNDWCTQPEKKIQDVIEKLKAGVEPSTVKVGKAELTCFCIEA